MPIFRLNYSQNLPFANSLRKSLGLCFTLPCNIFSLENQKIGDNAPILDT